MKNGIKLFEVFSLREIKFFYDYSQDYHVCSMPHFISRFILLPTFITATYKKIMENPFTANWTSKGHTLCLGHWEISYNGLPLTLPAERRDKDMGTQNIYNFMDPEDELYLEGLDENDWILANMDWLSDLFIQYNIPLEEEYMRAFYQAVNPEDWRCGSCGGCI